MQTLKINEGTAFNLYPNAAPEFKTMLEETFGKNFFTRKITDRIQGWNDILAVTGAHADDYKLRPGETDDELADRELKLVALAYNGGKVLDASNINEYKYYPWHRIVKDSSKPSGFGLAFVFYADWYSFSSVGVRHCFDCPENAIDAGKKFISIYERAKIR